MPSEMAWLPHAEFLQRASEYHEVCKDSRRVVKIRADPVLSHRREGEHHARDYNIEEEINHDERAQQVRCLAPGFFGKTLAELPLETKNRVSHRGRALAALKEALSDFL